MAVTVVGGRDSQSFSNKMTFSTSEGNEGGNHSANLGESNEGREKTQYTKDYKKGLLVC